MRIRIEMAFGLLTNKLRVLSTALQSSLANSSNILMACARLHNFCIDADHSEGVLNNAEVHSALNPMPPEPSAPLGWPFLPTVEPLRNVTGTSIMRDMILRQVEIRGMRRPNANIERRHYELHEIGLM